ncbi:MAG: magnesium/cobalt transporter CorA [Spirochaetaceae bacterium]|jgi:magnesium transporter|nr:magnesium/cobalt transporter CorA [Spirochaetaceae bacterium]
MAFSIIGYDTLQAWQETVETADELLAFRRDAGVTWINIDGPGSAAAIDRLAEVYDIHPLTVEDILNAEQRPKVEEFDEYLFVCLKAIRLDADGELAFAQVGLVIRENTVISFRTGDAAGDSFEALRRRILGNGGRVRRMGADYLAYALMDQVVDEYFSTLEYIGAGIEEFEDRAAEESDSKFIADIQKVRQQLLRVRRAIWPLRDSLSFIIRMDNPLLHDELDPFFKDLYENVMQAAETLDVYRELVAGVMEVNLSAVSNRMNKVMKVLTIISTLFIPLTFIVGVYGMNFQYMPELRFRYAYPLTWALMLVIAGGMLIYFKRRDWF